jgi:hypothetical protein
MTPKLPPAGKQRQQAFSACATFRHWWEPTNVTTDGMFYIQEMVCMRCTMQRRWKVHRRTGGVAGNSYTPPEGYYRKREPGEDGQQTRKELRLAEIERNRKPRRMRKAV